MTAYNADAFMPMFLVFAGQFPDHDRGTDGAAQAISS
jgi:hypothetical protein